MSVIIIWEERLFMGEREEPIMLSPFVFHLPNLTHQIIGTERWKSVWTCTFTPNGKITLDGVIKLHIHYYEDGNVQLRSETKKSSSCPGGVRFFFIIIIGIT